MNADSQAKLTHQLKTDEGLRLYAYDDSLGFATIGYGRLIDKRGGGISLDEAETLLVNDIHKVIAQLLPYVWYKAQDDVRQAALCNMTFNLGITGLLHFPKFLAHMALKEYSLAVTELQNTPWQHQVGARAERIMHMILSGAFP